MKKLTPLQRGYLLGYRHAKRKMTAELREMAERLDTEIAALRDDIAAACGIEVDRSRTTVAQALDAVEHDPDTPLLN